MRDIMASTAEAEYGTILINAQTAVLIRTNLSEMGRKQGPTAIHVASQLRNSARRSPRPLHYANDVAR